MKREVVTEKAQNRIFKKILKRPYNAYCADCPTKGPRWVSLDFGIFICMNCSGKLTYLPYKKGAHRALGP